MKPDELTQRTTEELALRRQELQFLATELGAAGAPPPPELSAEWDALEAELAKRRQARARPAG